MTKQVITILIFSLFLTAKISFAQPGPPDWVEIPDPAVSHFKFYNSTPPGRSRWIGFPDPNYSWEGSRLAWEREVTDEQGNPRVVKTYRKPIDIIAKFKPNSKVYGIDSQGKIEWAAVEKFGGSLKGFVWIENVDGEGEVVLPFTAPNIFIARGDRLNPVLTKISTDTSADNYYTTFEGKTHVFVSSFSGLGGVSDPPSTLIAHWRMNEDTANDNDELVTNGDFAAWTGDNPDGWVVSGESGDDPEISEAATGESHADTPTLGGGMCNLYTSDGTNINIWRFFSTVVGRKYRVSILVDTVTAGGIKVYENNNHDWTVQTITLVGTYSWTYVATITDPIIYVGRSLVEATDVTFDNISVKLCAAEDSSGNDHDGLLQEDTDVAHVAGKTGTGAFDFDGAADYIEIDDADAFTPAGTALSLSIWVYSRNWTSLPIVAKGVYNTDGEWKFYTDASDKLLFTRYDESVADCYIGRKYNTTALTSYENSWIHLVATSDGGTLSSGNKLYVNGGQVDDTDDENGVFVAVENLTHSVWVGYDDTNYADGLFDNLTIFSIELDQSDVNFLYSGGQGREDWVRYLLAKNN